MASSTSSVAPSASESSFATDSGSNSHKLAVTGAVLGVFGIIGIGIILWWTIKMKAKIPYGEEPPSTPVQRLQTSNSPGAGQGMADALRRSLTLNRSMSSGLGQSKSSSLNRNKSLAAKITPFNPDATTDGDGPRFVHTPGANMRIATRLSNGVWQFSEPVRGALGQIHPLAAASQASLLLHTQNIDKPSSRPHSPYLTPTSNPANPFSDANIYAPTRCESPGQNPFDSEETTENRQGLRRQGTSESHVSTMTATTTTTTTVSKYSFTRPSALTLRTQTQSVVRGTVYDLQSLSSAGTAVPAGIHDLDEDVVKNRGKPLPVADSELMRRGLRKESTLGALGILGSVSSLSLPLRQDSNDSHYGETGLSRRPSAASAVLLGGTGPVGTRNLSAANSGNRTTTYHPDLDEVVDVRGDTDDNTSVEMDLADVQDEDIQGAQALPNAAYGGLLTGASPYRMSEAFTSLDGHHHPSPSGHGYPQSISHASHLSTSTIGTSLYHHTISKDNSSSLGMGISNPYASTSTVYLGSLGHLTRPSLDSERLPGEFGGVGIGGNTHNNPSTARRGRPSLTIEPAFDKKGKRLSRNSTLATTYEGFEGENTLVYESPISPGGSYPYSPTSTSYTHGIKAEGTQAKNWQRQSSVLSSETHGYGYGYRKDNNNPHQLGLDDVYAADGSMSILGYYDREVEDDEEDVTIHAAPSLPAIDRGSGLEIEGKQVEVEVEFKIWRKHGIRWEMTMM
ncbi:hypothetical protein J3R30DRAFT_3407791 [Lentinula aciculospora]|uniref:Uncharacterized protein n=1 Tax=Lentinula aciculospora TaxID=153920 RepID=A0A9W9A0B3_9AGAR|nr:hypothetical protein J3R30DRAFT_3407791 [Lentinula aciculospora]